MKNKKSSLWNMRATKDDRSNLAELAKRLKVNSESEAVRRAVVIALLATDPRRETQAREMIAMV